MHGYKAAVLARRLQLVEKIGFASKPGF